MTDDENARRRDETEQSRRLSGQWDHYDEIMTELAKFDVEEIKALREFLRERAATKWLFGRMKNIAIWATTILGAIALFSQTTAEWFRHWLGMKP